MATTDVPDEALAPLSEWQREWLTNHIAIGRSDFVGDIVFAQTLRELATERLARQQAEAQIAALRGEIMDQLIITHEIDSNETECLVCGERWLNPGDERHEPSCVYGNTAAAAEAHDATVRGETREACAKKLDDLLYAKREEMRGLQFDELNAVSSAADALEEAAAALRQEQL